jgi:inner membrane transporter RhtA
LLLLGEHLSAIQWLAIGCIVAASMGSAMTAGRPSADADRAAPQAA